jgi:16S rRNA (adenine1518-N6/adenine1519-N6)-dimethyltransferase
MWRPSELHYFLKSRGLRPRRALSQNFLVDGNILGKIVQIAQITPNASVLEVGPGTGALTSHLLEAGARVVAVEKDRALAEALTQNGSSSLHVVHADILDFDLQTLPAGTVVVANLPYHVTTPVLSRLISRHDKFQRLVVMVQEEVARRLAAPAGSKLYGSISVFLQLQAKVEVAFRVSRRCFSPVPRVDSAVVRLDLHPPPVSNPHHLFAFTRAAFSQRRKMVRNCLARWVDPHLVAAELEGMGYAADSRAERLCPRALTQLFQRLEPVLANHFASTERE